MFKRKYYYLVSGLNNIAFEANKNIVEFQLFIDQLKELLHPKDFELVKLLIADADIENLKNLLLADEQKFNPYGNFNIEELEQFLKFPDEAPLYMQSCILKVKAKEISSEFEIERVLLVDFYNFVLAHKSKYITKWFEYQLALKNILSAINCRKYELNLETQIIPLGEVSEQLLKNKSKDFGLAKNYPFVETLTSAYDSLDILSQEKTIDQIVWDKAEELCAMDNFTVEAVLSYVLKLKIAYRWNEMESHDGQAAFKQILEKLQSGVNLSEKF